MCAAEFDHTLTGTCKNVAPTSQKTNCDFTSKTNLLRVLKNLSEVILRTVRSYVQTVQNSVQLMVKCNTNFIIFGTFKQLRGIMLYTVL